MKFRAVAVVLMFVTWCAPTLAHPPEEHAAAKDAPKLPQAIFLPDFDGPKPWSDKPLLNDPNRFHIAIMTDRTGGHRPGIWMKAVERLNLLRPEFVMSVGDLIEGYTEDVEQLDKEWKEFLGFVDKMQMKFFFAAGNHDVTNPVMHKLWRERFGAEWYSFDYKGVHFVCLSSEDPVSRIGDEQLAWLAGDLEKHKDARWTLVFLHKPLWAYSERARAAGNSDNTNWPKVEALLGERQHTVFSGHVHHYVQYDRNGMKYYHLATTGGGSRLRGVPYGEFDHVVWLTMEKDGPHVVNLLLDGIIPADTVTEGGIARFRDFLAKTHVEVAPILVEDEEGFTTGRIELTLANGFDQPVELSGRIEGLPLRGLTLEPASITLSAPPGKTATLSADLLFSEKMSFTHLAQTLLTAKIKSADGDRPLAAERLVPVIIDRGYPCPAVTKPVVIDGNLDEWPELTLATGREPLVLGAAEAWQGPSDASLRFATAHDAKFVYVAARVDDERVLANGDAFELRFDARAIGARRRDGRLREGSYAIRLAAPGENGAAKLRIAGYRGAKGADATQARATRTAAGYDVELAVPLAAFNGHQDGEWRNFQLTAAVVDVDEPGGKPCRVVWRGSKDLDTRNTNFGHFTRPK